MSGAEVSAAGPGRGGGGAGPGGGAAARFAAADVFRLWRASWRVAPGYGLGGWRDRYRFLVRSLGVRHQVAPYLRPEGGPFGRAVAGRPELVGAAVWPYISVSWGPAERLDRIRGHYAAVAARVPAFDFGVDEERELADLGDRLPGLRVVLDQPKWFIREGQLALNLFLGGDRVFTLAFSLGLDPDLVAYVGAIQGRNLDGVLDTYRQLTRALHDMRPRDFLIEVFRDLCRAAGVARILAVSDAYRHHRDPYFGARSTFTTNYDEVWAERGGVPAGPDFFALPVGPNRRDLDEVPAKKRSTYRKRYAMLDGVEEQVARAVR